MRHNPELKYPDLALLSIIPTVETYNYVQFNNLANYYYNVVCEKTVKSM